MLRLESDLGSVLVISYLMPTSPSVADLINDNPDVEEEEEEGGEESGEEVEEGGGEGEEEKKRKGKRKRRGLCVHVLSSFRALLYHVHIG